ncbi:unnamed protein product [Cunninghamella blakesleeana]
MNSHNQEIHNTQEPTNVPTNKKRSSIGKFFSGIKEFIDKGKTDAVKAKPPEIINRY